MANLLVPGGGLKYMNGGAGVPNQVSTNNFSAGSLSLVTGGITGAQIDGGLVSYNLYSQFSTYLFQPALSTTSDYATLFVQFLDGSSSPIGTPLSLGGQAFTYALGSGDNGSYSNARDWGADALAGVVPSGARFANVSIQTVKVAEGTAIDGYVDNVNILIEVPEPGLAGLFALGGGLLALVRRRR